MIFKNLFKSNDLKLKSLSWLNKDITVILDNGHGKGCPNSSPKWPDGTKLYEWQLTRDIVGRIVELLEKDGIPYHILVPEDKDISLQERVRRVDKIWKSTNKKCFLISIHSNAGGGTGWEVWTSIGKTKSDQIASIFWNEMKSEFPTQKMRLDMTDGDVDKEKNYYILYNTKCPAILTENFFHDNEKDCRDILLKPLMVLKIANAHVNAIKKTLMNLY